jgi:hypothetical protein
MRALLSARRRRRASFRRSCFGLVIHCSIFRPHGPARARFRGPHRRLGWLRRRQAALRQTCRESRMQKLRDSRPGNWRRSGAVNAEKLAANAARVRTFGRHAGAEQFGDCVVDKNWLYRGPVIFPSVGIADLAMSRCPYQIIERRDEKTSPAP